MEKNFEKITFGARLKSMLKVDFRRAFTMPLFYIMIGVCFVVPILILVMTGMMAGSVSIDPVTKEETVMEGFKNVWQAIGSVSGSAAEKLTLDVARELSSQGVPIDEVAIRLIYEEITTSASLDPATRARYREIKRMIDEDAPKYGNDIREVDMFARDVANSYTKEIEKYRNPRGGVYQAGLYPVSANVPLGASTGATPDARLAYTPLADGIGPASGRDVKGPTATANSVAKLEQGIASNGTLLNQKFHPSALAGMSGLTKFVALIRSYFDQKGMHMQFNVVTRETLIDAQNNPEKYKTLVVRVAGYSALFTTLSRSLQNDIINRTEQGW